MSEADMREQDAKTQEIKGEYKSGRLRTVEREEREDIARY